MFSSNDFISYFSSLEQSVKKLKDIYNFAQEHIDDRTLRKIFKDLAQTEESHQAILNELREVITRSSLKKSK